MSASPALASFEAAWTARQASPGAASPLQELRANAMARFNRLGLPTMRDESWHYSNLRALALRSFHAPDIGSPAPPQEPDWLQQVLDAQVLHLVNGVPAGALPSLPGVTLQTLAELERSDPARLLTLSPPASDAEEQRWLLLNTALYENGLYLRLSGRLERPLLIVHHASGGDGSLVNPRVIIEAGAGSEAVLIEQHADPEGDSLLRNSACIIALGEGAKLEHYRLFCAGGNATHIDHLAIRAAARAHLRQHTVVLGGGFVRATLEASLDAPEASLDSHTLLTGHAERHADCVNLVRHAAPRTRSRQTARVIAADRSRAIFNSKVIVAAGAMKADSLQSCRGLLLSPGAEIDTRPQLEIFADDVKCAHGATTGRLDPDMLFYLLSRGLEPAAAQSLLVFAFLADVLTGMSLTRVREAIESRLVAQLPDSPTLRQFR